MSWVGQVPFTELGMTQELMTLLVELSEGGGYWTQAYGFVNNVSGRTLSSLTDRQRDWLDNIVASLNVELNKRTAKEVWEQ